MYKALDQRAFKLGTPGGLDHVVYYARAGQIPRALQEIGRQREIAFRAVGEGTDPALLTRYMGRDNTDAYRALHAPPRRDTPWRNGT